MPNPRVASVRAARRTTRELKVLFGQMGTTQRPRGRILRAYRVVRLGARSAFNERMPHFALSEVLSEFRLAMSRHINHFLVQARNLGQNQAEAEIEAWELPGTGQPPRSLQPERDAWLKIVDAQIAATEASPVPAFVLGGGTQLGILQPSPAIQAGAHWLTAAAIAFWFFGVERATRIDRRPWEWFKQAIPAIDERTTDCCLRVAGQAVPLSSEFKLTGTPRFADEQAWSPFHNWCRTSVSLVPDQFKDDDLTQKLEGEARLALRVRREAKEEARGIIDQLAELSTPTDSRARSGDTKKITGLRKRLLDLRGLAGYDLGG